MKYYVALGTFAGTNPTFYNLAKITAMMELGLHRSADQAQHQNQYGRERRPESKHGRDNVFVERLWKSVKYEEVYLRAYDSVADARGLSGISCMGEHRERR
jgi:hypothetical protein